MIAELAAANAAFGVIKETIANGKELYEAGQALADYFGLKAEIQKKAHEHGYKSDLEAFMATEQLKEYEEALKQMMIWQGRAGLWTDWLDYQKKMKASREAAERAEKAKKAKRKKQIVDWCVGIGLGISVLTAVGLVIYIFYWLSKQG
jgi:tRNA G37 N-methylase Trm5